MNTDSSRYNRLKSYVLRATRMSKLQRRSYEELLPKYSIPFAEIPLKPEVVFPGKNKIIAEIGFGMGDATVRIAEENMESGFLGIEVHRPGVGKVLSEIDSRGLENLRIINHDAVEVFEKMFPDDFLSGIHIFFPDPWPKKKHHKRRLIQPDFLNIVISKLKNSGYLYICTDWEDYALQILDVCTVTEGIRNAYEGFAEHQPWRPETKFESKGLEKSHTIREILFRKDT